MTVYLETALSCTELKNSQRSYNLTYIFPVSALESMEVTNTISKNAHLCYRNLQFDQVTFLILFLGPF
jgi:hypothetical protein